MGESEKNINFFIAKRFHILHYNPVLLNIHPDITTAAYKESDYNEHLL